MNLSHMATAAQFQSNIKSAVNKLPDISIPQMPQIQMPQMPDFAQTYQNYTRPRAHSQNSNREEIPPVHTDAQTQPHRQRSLASPKSYSNLRDKSRDGIHVNNSYDSGYGETNRAADSEKSWGSKIVSVVSGRFAEEDDDTIGPDGDTKLTRVMKQYYVDRAQSTADLPKWLFPNEVSRPQMDRSSASTGNISLNLTRSDLYRQEPPRQDPYRLDPYRQPTSSSRSAEPSPALRSAKSFSNLSSSTGADATSAGTGSRARDRLLAMREAKRMGHS